MPKFNVFHYVFPIEKSTSFFTRFDASRQLRSSKSYVHQFPRSDIHHMKLDNISDKIYNFRRDFIFLDIFFIKWKI